jgi:hypothetical protein
MTHPGAAVAKHIAPVGTLEGGCYTTRPSISCVEETPVGLPDSLQSYTSTNESLRLSAFLLASSHRGSKVCYSFQCRKKRLALPGDSAINPASEWPSQPSTAILPRNDLKSSLRLSLRLESRNFCAPYGRKKRQRQEVRGSGVVPM